MYIFANATKSKMAPIRMKIGARGLAGRIAEPETRHQWRQPPKLQHDGWLFWQDMYLENIGYEIKLVHGDNFDMGPGLLFLCKTTYVNTQPTFCMCNVPQMHTSCLKIMVKDGGALPGLLLRNTSHGNGRNTP